MRRRTPVATRPAEAMTIGRSREHGSTLLTPHTRVVALLATAEVGTGGHSGGMWRPGTTNWLRWRSLQRVGCAPVPSRLLRELRPGGGPPELLPGGDL